MDVAGMIRGADPASNSNEVNRLERIAVIARAMGGDKTSAARKAEAITTYVDDALERSLAEFLSKGFSVVDDRIRALVKPSALIEPSDDDTQWWGAAVDIGREQQIFFASGPQSVEARAETGAKWNQRIVALKRKAPIGGLEYLAKLQRRLLVDCMGIPAEAANKL